MAVVATNTNGPQLGLRRALDYTLKRWPALLCYLDDARVPIDNNRTENCIRPVAVGRKKWIVASRATDGIYPESAGNRQTQRP